MQSTVKDPFYRPITHYSYKTEEVVVKLKKGGMYTPKLIFTDDIVELTPENVTDDEAPFRFNHKYIANDVTDKGIAIWGGGFSLFCLILFLWGENLTDPKTWDVGMLFFIGIPLLVLLFCIYYYVKVPKKEQILDRMRGTITFGGGLFYKNITMPFNEAIFHLNQGGTRGLNAFRLSMVVRPTNLSYAVLTIGNDYKQSMSLITWYMDKNRPLPPGAAFDPYREADFERRKEEGFLPPLYPSQISTPEATKEQQKERDKYWKDLDYITNIKY